ncbi:MAG: hypothetical protein ACXWLX_10235 [Rhizomicrobium sp.]
MTCWRKDRVRFAALIAGSLVVAGTFPLAAADRPVTLPLSQLPAFPAPALALDGLSPAVARNVKAALADAAEGMTRTAPAEAAIRAATEAARNAREAAKRAGREEAATLDGASCRYGGEIKDGKPEGLGVMTCGGDTYAGHFHNGMPDGPVAAQKAGVSFLGDYRAGKANGLGGDTALQGGDAYEGEYKDGARVGFGVERDKDGVYPGRFGFYADPKDKAHRIDMVLSGRQDFATAHWAGRFGAFLGPKIACTIIKGATLEGSVLDGAGAKFDAAGKLAEQGLYATGLLKDAKTPPC